MPKFPFPEKIDNTALAEFQDCRKFFYWDMVRRIRPKGSNIHLDFGGAFARGLERMRRAFYEEGKSQEECEYLGLETAFEAFKDVEVPEEEASKTAHGLIRALEVYTDTWPFETDALQPARFESGKYGIEFSFAIPMEVKHPETGNPIILCGRSDMIGEMKNLPGAYYVVDEKTAKQQRTRTLWDARSQFMCYCWAAKYHKIPVVGAVVRQIIMHKYDIPAVEIIITHPDWRLERWYENAVKSLQEMIWCWQEDYFSYNFSSYCNTYNGCHYGHLCTAKDPEPWIQIDFRPNTWDPLLRVETL